MNRLSRLRPFFFTSLACVTVLGAAPNLIAQANTAQANTAQPGSPATTDGDTSGSTIQLLVEGTIDQVRVTSAWKRSFVYRELREHDAPTGWIRLIDDRGAELAKVQFDLSTVNRDRGANKGRTIAVGDTLLEGRITRLVKIPNYGVRLARIDFESVEGTRTVKLGSTSGAELRRIVFSTDAVQPLVAPTVRTHINNGPISNRYDIVVIGDAYRASDEAQFVADVNAWTANLFAKEPFKAYARFFNVHSVFRASVDNLADKPLPCQNPPIVRNTVYDAGYCVNGTDRCLYIKGTTLASQDAALAPDVEGRIVVFVNDPKYGGCASTFAVSYNGSQGAEVQTHEFGHSFGGLADEYNYGQTGCYNGPEPTAANITKDTTCSKWSLWKGFNGVGCFEGAGYYPKCMFRPKSNCLMNNLGIPLCEVCREELVLDGYTTVNPIENATPSGSVSLTKPATQLYSFTNLVPASSNPLVRWYVDNVLRQSSSVSSFTFASNSYSPGLHTIRLEVFDQTAFVRKDLANKRTRTRSWTVTVKDGAIPGEYTTYGIGCVGTGKGANCVVVPSAYAGKWGESANYYPHGRPNIRYQQVFLGSEVGSRTIGGVSFRLDETYGGAAGSFPVTITLGHTTKTPATLDTSSTFASNFNSGTPVQVFSGILNFPAHTPPNSNLASFLPSIAFQTPFVFNSSRNLLIQIDNNGSGSDVSHFFDSCSGNTTRVYATPIAATPTGMNQSSGLVMCFQGPTTGQVLPRAYATSMGNVQNSFPFATSNLRYQQVFAQSETSTATFTGLGLRHGAFSPNAGGTRSLSIFLGHTTRTPLTLGTSFDANFIAGTKSQVFSGSVNLPATVSANANPGNWDSNWAFTAPFVHQSVAGRNLLIEVVQTSANSLANYSDATSTGNTTRLFANPSTAATGSLGVNYGLIMRFNTAGSAASGIPALDHIGVPEIGKSFQITLAHAPAGALAAIWVGFSKINVPLPNNLAPGCSLYAALDVFPLTAVVADAAGFGSIVYPIPNNTAFRGVRFYNEWFVFDKTANNLGLTFSNGGEAKIGG